MHTHTHTRDEDILICNTPSYYCMNITIQSFVHGFPCYSA